MNTVKECVDYLIAEEFEEEDVTRAVNVDPDRVVELARMYSQTIGEAWVSTSAELQYIGDQEEDEDDDEE